MKWNKEQLEAIYSTGKNIIVSASAGAGKTAILVERLLTLCTREKNPIDLNRIVAMTFTDAAASEMKKRLSKKLSEKLFETNVNKELIQKQLIYLNTAQISTIHSFCLSIIKKYYDVLNLNPSMIENNLEEGVVKNIKQKAFINAFYQYQENSDVTQLINFFSVGIFNLNKLSETVINIVEAASSTFDENGYYELILDKYKPIKAISEIETTILDLFFSKINTHYEILKTSFDELFNQFNQEKLSMDKQEEIYKKSELNSYYITNIKNAINEKKYYDFYSALTSLNDNKCKIRKNNTMSENFVELNANYRKLVNDINKEYYDEAIYVSANNEILPIITQLVDLAKLTSKEIKNEKIKINGFDFDDMEHFAYDILKANNNMIAEQIKQEIDEVLVDEFQDTNEIQNEIINLISKKDNVFRVGDVKQSIYRFRKAKPSIMRSMMNDENYKLIALKNNYRSKDNIISFTNLLFKKIMNIETLSDKYENSDIVSGGSEIQKEYKENTIVFYALKENKELYDNNMLKADFISNKINDFVLNKNYKYKDFVILLRSHNHKKEIQKSFEKFNIPYFIDAKSGFFNSYMSKIITGYLKLINNINDSISLMAVLTSPLYEESDENIAKMVIEHKTLLNACINLNHPVIDDIKRLKKLPTISEILIEISLINNFINEKCDNQQRSNFDLYFEKVLNFEKNSTNLEQLITIIESTDDKKSSEAISIGIDEDVVRVMTIHQSKGLQFKVVFLWGNSHKGTNNNLILTSPNNGIALDNIERKYYTVKEKTVHSIALQHEDDIEDAQEFIRILYVALTRAQEEMYIVDTVKKEIFSSDYTLNKALSNSNKITNTLLEALEDQKLFNIHYIEDINFNIPEAITKPKNNILPHFSYTKKENIEIITPSKSSHELNLALNFDNTDTFSRGLLMHKAVEILPNKIWDKFDLSIIKDLNQYDINHLIKFNQSEIYKQALNMKIYHEFPFVYKEDTKIINGIIDFFAIDDKNIIILDFKSDRNVSEEDLLSLYKQQLNFYLQSIKKLYPNHLIQTYIYSFSLDRFIKIS